MEDWHLTPEHLERLLARERDEDDNRALLHQIAVCPDCRVVGGYLLDLSRSGALGPVWGSIDAALARSRAEAPVLLEKLTRFSFDRAEGLVRDARQFRSWGLAELLAAESLRVAPENATRAVELAELAVIVAARLEEWEPAERTWLLQLRALTYAHLGNARRVLGELRSARRAFRDAERLWEAGAHDAGDSLGYEALIFALMASLEREERRLPEAAALLDRALHAEADCPLRASILFNQAAVLDELGRSEEAIALLHEAEALVDKEQSPRLVRVARHNLLVFLTNAGRYDEARMLLPEVRHLSRESGEGLDMLRCVWAEARLTAEDAPHEAARLFEEVRREFLARRMHYDFALASIELALLHARAHRLDEVKEIAAAILPIFETADVHREALAAVTLFVRAVEVDAKDALLFNHLADYLRRARHNPSLRFEEPDSPPCEVEE